MKRTMAILTLVILSASLAHTDSERAPEHGEESQVIDRAGSHKSFRAPEDMLAADARIDMLLAANEVAHDSRDEITEEQRYATQEGNMSERQMHYPADSQEPFKGPDDWFTGDVEVKPLFPANEVAHYSGAYVTFQPGARTAWHLHPAGQHMIVTAGVGLTGTRDGKIIEFRSGDTIWCPPDIDHWHGATPDSAMTHLVITGDLDGENVVWKEKVTDEQYHGYGE